MQQIASNRSFSKAVAHRIGSPLMESRTPVPLHVSKLLGDQYWIDLGGKALPVKLHRGRPLVEYDQINVDLVRELIQLLGGYLAEFGR